MITSRDLYGFLGSVGLEKLATAKETAKTAKETAKTAKDSEDKGRDVRSGSIKRRDILRVRKGLSFEVRKALPSNHVMVNHL